MESREIEIDPIVIVKTLPVILIVIALVVMLLTSWVTVEPEERGVVLRFGKYHDTFEPGLHFKMPLGIDRVYKVPVKRQLKQEFGFRTSRAGVQSEYSPSGFDDESIMLSGDLNVADVEWVTQYRIINANDYLFKVRNLDKTFRDMNEAVMREIIGDRSINEILTTGRLEIESLVKEELQILCKQYEMGISIDQVILQDVNPPEAVKSAFNEVNQAQQEKEQMINQAQQAYNKVIPKARGDAAKTIQEAEGYAVERVNRAQGEANRFNAVFEEYQKASEVTRNRIYLETMAEIMGKVGDKVIMDDNVSGVLPLLNLNKEGAK